MKRITSLLASLMAVTCLSAQTYVYQKVTIEPSDWSGEYLIVREIDETNEAIIFNGALTDPDLDGAQNTITAPCPYNANNIRCIASTAETDASTFIIVHSNNAGAYTIKSKSGLWIGYDKADPIEADMSTDNMTSYDNFITMVEGKTNVNIESKNGYFLQYNDKAGKERFRYYTANDKKSIKLYKKINTTTTAIDDINTDNNSIEYFDLSGKKVTNPSKGIYVTKKGLVFIK
ncbi:MAG: hypothetical protein MJZ15_11765 [Bacteroidales bacterium]|nr:hypothetical protein [Bacteroidales bacterium]